MNYEILLESLENEWKNSRALKLLIPDWLKFKELCGINDKAHHKPSLLLAYERGYLNNIVNPIEWLLAESENQNKSISKQYQKDLQEKWLESIDEIERHKKFKIFFGKLLELIYAKYLVDLGYSIINLEAWDKNAPDIVISDSNNDYNIDVKYIGGNTDFFTKMLKSKNGVTTSSIDISYDFLLFKIYEAYTKLGNRNQLSNNVCVCLVEPSLNFIEFKNINFNDIKFAFYNDFLVFLNDNKIDKNHFIETILKAVDHFTDIRIYTINDFIPILQTAKTTKIKEKIE